MKLGRRKFLAGSLATLGVGVLGVQTGCQPQNKITFYQPYDRLTLGNTGIKVSRLCMGTGMKGWMRQSNQTRLGEKKFLNLIQAAYDRGIRVFDLADLYGTHQYVAKALKGIDRDKYVLISKIWWRDSGLPEKERPDADIVVNRFCKELDTDYIDVALLHCVVSGDWPNELRRQMDILAKLKEKNIIGAHGISCHSLDALKAAVNEPWVDSVNTRINPYGIKMDGPAEEVAPVLRQLHDAGKGVVGMKLIGEGSYRDSDEKRDHAVKYVLELGCVDVLNVGFENTQEIDDFAARVRKVPTKTT